MKPCPSKRSHINPGRPPRVCYATCDLYQYAAHLIGDSIKPAIVEGRCPNHVPRVGPTDEAGKPAD